MGNATPCLSRHVQMWCLTSYQWGTLPPALSHLVRICRSNPERQRILPYLRDKLCPYLWCARTVFFHWYCLSSFSTGPGFQFPSCPYLGREPTVFFSIDILCLLFLQAPPCPYSVSSPRTPTPAPGAPHLVHMRCPASFKWKTLPPCCSTMSVSAVQT